VSRIGITGHSNLSASTVPLVLEAIKNALAATGAKTRWLAAATTATFPAAVRETEEVVPVNLTTWVLPSGVTVGR
jgi:hypothetical protein